MLVGREVVRARPNVQHGGTRAGNELLDPLPDALSRVLAWDHVVILDVDVVVRVVDADLDPRIAEGREAVHAAHLVVIMADDEYRELVRREYRRIIDLEPVGL